MPQLNNRYSKTDIIEMYLNSIYYGEQAYGIDAAASVYFGLKDQAGKPAAKQLDIAQAAMLAGIPASPSSYDPLQHPQASFNRFKEVLSFMQRNGYISRLDVINAIEEAQQPRFFKQASTLINRAPHFAETRLFSVGADLPHDAQATITLRYDCSHNARYHSTG